MVIAYSFCQWYVGLSVSNSKLVVATLQHDKWKQESNIISLSRILAQTSLEAVNDTRFSTSSSSSCSEPVLSASSVLATIELASRANWDLARMAWPVRRKIIGIGSRPNVKNPKSETTVDC